MINVKVKKLPKSRKDALIVESANVVAEVTAKEIKKTTKDIKCKKHPNRISTLFVVADKKDIFTIDKSKFCCKEFADSIQFKDISP